MSPGAPVTSRVYPPSPDLVRLLLTPEEAAETLAVSRSRIYELLGDGSLPSVRLGRARRIRHSDLVRFVEKLS